MKKIVLWIFGALVLIIFGLILFVNFSWQKKYDVPFPDISASKDSALIERGKYLVYGPAHCSHCHVPMNMVVDVEKGLQIPLSGGWELQIAPGTFRAPNLTPDIETGIGNMSDGQLARAMRYSIGHDNRYLGPFMPFQELSDEDLTAIISFLRTQEAVFNEIKKTELSFLGKALLAFGIIEPVGPINAPPESVVIDSTIEYGSYLANSVANCYGCHTERDLKSGAFIGAPYAGGMRFDPDSLSQGYSFISPNLTPDPGTGVMASWSEKVFIDRFRIGRMHAGSPMPWGATSRMTELELKALYRYLRSLDPVAKRIDKTVFVPGEIIP